MSQFLFKVHPLMTGNFLTSGTPFIGVYVPAAQARSMSLGLYITGLQSTQIKLEYQDPYSNIAPYVLWSGIYNPGAVHIPITGRLPIPNIRISATGQSCAVFATLYQQKLIS